MSVTELEIKGVGLVMSSPRGSQGSVLAWRGTFQCALVVTWSQLGMTWAGGIRTG